MNTSQEAPVGSPAGAPEFSPGLVRTEPHGARRERVYTTLRAELMSGRIHPSERLAEERLAERFEVSRTPVREALARLLSDGLVVKRDGGVYLYVPSFEALTQLYELRVTLELQGVRRAIEDPTVRHDRALLDEELAHWHTLAADRPPPAPGFVTVDEQFHTTLLLASGNAELAAALGQVNRRIRAVRMHDYLTENRMEATVTEHIEIAELVLRDRLPRALEALREHVGASRDVVMERAARALAVAQATHPDRRVEA